MLLTFGLLLALLGACAAKPQQTPSAETPAQSSAPTDASASAETPATSSDSETAESSTGLTRGTWKDGVYTNEFTGLRYVLPEGWVVATDEQLASMMGIGAEAFGDKQKWAAETAEKTTIYDTMVQDPATQNNISILYENLAISGNTKISEEDYFAAVKAQMQNLEKLSYTFGELYKAKLNGVDYLVAPAVETTNKVSQYYLLHKQDKYMVCVIVSIFDDTKADEILAQFK